MHAQSQEVTTRNRQALSTRGSKALPEMMDLRKKLLAYVEKSNALSTEQVKDLREGGAKRKSDPNDSATRLESEMRNVAINSIVFENVVAAIKVIKEIDNGWDSYCLVCEEDRVPDKVVLISYSMICPSCKNLIPK